MAYTHRELSGTLFRNDKKQNGSKQPDYRGGTMIDGVEYEIAGWKKDGNRGPFLSLAFKVKETAPPSDRDVEGPVMVTTHIADVEPRTTGWRIRGVEGRLYFTSSGLRASACQIAKDQGLPVTIWGGKGWFYFEIDKIELGVAPCV